jgi:hypothetical protein
MVIRLRTLPASKRSRVRPTSSSSSSTSRGVVECQECRPHSGRWARVGDSLPGLGHADSAGRAAGSWGVRRWTRLAPTGGWMRESAGIVAALQRAGGRPRTGDGTRLMSTSRARTWRTAHPLPRHTLPAALARRSGPERGGGRSAGRSMWSSPLRSLSPSQRSSLQPSPTEAAPTIPTGRTSTAARSTWAGRPWRLDPVAALASVVPDGSLDLAEHATAIDQLLGGAWPAEELWICTYVSTTLRRDHRPG